MVQGGATRTYSGSGWARGDCVAFKGKVGTWGRDRNKIINAEKKKMSR